MVTKKEGKQWLSSCGSGVWQGTKVDFTWFELLDAVLPPHSRLHLHQAYWYQFPLKSSAIMDAVSVKEVFSTFLLFSDLSS